MMDLPRDLNRILEGYTLEKDDMGCSDAGVYRCVKNGGETLYLKIWTDLKDARREYDTLRWLDGKVGVPQVKYWGGDKPILLMTEMSGFMSCAVPRGCAVSAEKTAELLAEGILMLQSVDISDCPIKATLDVKLEKALYYVENDMVDMDDWDDGNTFTSPRELYDWLAENKPAEDLCFVHGDYCLPNIFIDGEKVTGFIDFGQAGVADKYQDIALCVRSFRYNLGEFFDISDDKIEGIVTLLFKKLNIAPDWEKIHYYMMMDELF